MSSSSPAFNKSNGVASDSAAPQQAAPARWSRLPSTVRSPVWPGIVGVLISLAMLLAFYQVVHDAVQQGATRLQAAAIRNEASWRCNKLPSQSTIESCLIQLDPMAYSARSLPDQTTLVSQRD